MLVIDFKIMTRAIISSFLIITAANAEGRNVKNDAFYVGGAMGSRFSSIKAVTSISMPGLSVESRNILGTQGVNGGLFAGYDKTFSNNIYLGIEGAGEIYNLSTTHLFKASGESSIFQYAKQRDSLSIAGRIGAQFNGSPPLIYLKAGAAFNSYRVSTTVTSTLPTAYGEEKKRITQALIGLGIEFPIEGFSMKSTRIGFEAEHTIGRTIKVLLKSATFTGTSKFTPAPISARIRLTYKF